MTFLNWSILFGLAAVAIPIVIHLFNRRKARVVDWGAMQFLLGSLVNRKRRILVEELILMALRCLLVAVLVLAVARPFVPVTSDVMWLVVLPVILLTAVAMAVATILARRRRWRWPAYAGAVAVALAAVWLSQNEHLRQAARWKSSTAHDVAIVIDGSSSMRVQVDGSTNFERAVREARTLVDSLGPDDHVAVIVAGGAAEAVTPEPVSVRSDVDAIFDSLAAPGGTLPVSDALAAAAATLAAGNNPLKKIVLISDGQQIGWQTDNRSQWEFLSDTLEQLPTKPKLVSRFLALPDRFQNAAVASVEPSRQVIGTDREVTFRIRVENTGWETIEPSGLQLRLEDDTILASEVGAIEAGQSVQLDFAHRFASPGTRAIEARLLVKDDLDDDNQQVHVLHVLDTLPILLVDGAAQVRKPDQATSLVEIALSPPAYETAENAARPLISTTVIAAPDLSDQVRFADYRVVLLADVPRLGATTAESLTEFVQNGGGVLIAPGRRSEPEFYNDWKTADGRPVLPAQLQQRVLIDAGQQTTRPIADSFKHPALLRLLATSQTDLARAVISAYWQLEPLKNEANVFVGAALDGGDPFLVEQPLGRGAVAVLSTTLDEDGSTLPSLVSFLPLMHELAYHLASPASVDLNHEPARVLTVDVPHSAARDASGAAASDGPRSIEVTTPSGKSRKATLTRHAERSVISFAGAIEPGLYRAELPQELAERFASVAMKKGGTSYVPICVAAAPEESRLVPLTDRDEAIVARHLDYFRAANTEQMVAAVTGDVPGHELWKYLAIAAVIIILAESFVTGWIARQRKQGTAQAVDFISEGERLSTFQERARQLLETVRAP